ncbi:hypothetical protein KHP62_20315 [Rhodobacteraceae bacterium NNCM2]|nr:hypothetical protein [Coraliihabitans acroporae]
MQKAVFAAVLAGMFFLATPAGSQTIVNGKLLSRDEINWLANYSCGPIWPGNYWLNTATGQWGFAGNPVPMGYIRDRCRGRRQPSLSERGQLYRPGEILGGY